MYNWDKKIKDSLVYNVLIVQQKFNERGLIIPSPPMALSRLYDYK